MPGANPVETAKVLYPADLVFLHEEGWVAPGHAVVDVARDGKVVAEVNLRRSGGSWTVECVTDGDFSPKYFPVPN